MNRKNEWKLILKIIIMIFLLTGLFFSLFISWNFLKKAKQLNLALVQSNKPFINEDLIMKAGAILDKGKTGEEASDSFYSEP